MTISDNIMKKLFTGRKQYSSSELAMAIALSILFLGLVAAAQVGLRDVDAEIVFVALVPLLILLIIFGILKGIETPMGLKIFFDQPLHESNSMRIRTKNVNEAIVAADAKRVDGTIVEAEEFQDNNDLTAIKDRIFDKDTHVLSFEIEKDEPYPEEVVEACMDAIVSDPSMTIRYLQFTEKKGRFEGMLRISDCLHNGIILSAISPDTISWTDLASDINDGSVLKYPGTVTEDLSISAQSSIRDALSTMKTLDRTWLPVLKGGRLFGVVSEAQLLRDVILAWMDEEENEEVASQETATLTTIGETERAVV